MNTLARPQLLAHLQRALQGIDAVDAAWEGGSAAFGSDDDLSDIDAVAVVADDGVDAAFAAVEAELAALSPIVLTQHTGGGPGFRQRFYRLRDAGEFLVVDLVMIRRSDPLLFRELELHGRGRTWFDRRGVLVEAHLDAGRDLAAAQARVPILASAFAMFQHIVTKERLRGRAVEALVFYQGMTWRPLRRGRRATAARTGARAAATPAAAAGRPRGGRAAARGRRAALGPRSHRPEAAVRHRGVAPEPDRQRGAGRRTAAPCCHRAAFRCVRLAPQ